MTYFTSIPPEELAKRDRAVKEMNDRRTRQCEKVLEDYRTGKRKPKK